MAGARDRYDAGKRKPSAKPVGADGLTYEQQRAIDPAVARRIQDDMAVRLLINAFSRIEEKRATAFDLDLATSFLRGLVDATLVDVQVSVSDARAQQLIDLVRRHGMQTVGFQRSRRTARGKAS
jgi:hypothetical protein